MRHVDQPTLDAIINHQLSPRELARLKDHVRDCPLCARRLEEYRDVFSEVEAIIPTAASDVVHDVAPRSWRRILMPRLDDRLPRSDRVLWGVVARRGRGGGDRDRDAAALADAAGSSGCIAAHAAGALRLRITPPRTGPRHLAAPTQPPVSAAPRTPLRAGHHARPPSRRDPTTAGISSSRVRAGHPGARWCGPADRRPPAGSLRNGGGDPGAGRGGFAAGDSRRLSRRRGRRAARRTAAAGTRSGRYPGRHGGSGGLGAAVEFGGILALAGGPAAGGLARTSGPDGFDKRGESNESRLPRRPPARPSPPPPSPAALPVAHAHAKL